MSDHMGGPMTGPSLQSSSHPETTCRRCGGPNVSWAAPSPLWNAVMRGGSINGPWEFDELICPTCFCVLAEQRGVAVGWTVGAKVVHVELEAVTPSGRVWDAGAQLWVALTGDQQLVAEVAQLDVHELRRGRGHVRDTSRRPIA